VRKIGLILKRQDPRVRGILAEIVPWLRDNGVSIVVDQSWAQDYSCECEVAGPAEFASRADAVVVFGGDGTLLYAARLVGASGVPILGINLGSLGFLAEVKLEDMRTAFESLLAGGFTVQERMLLDVKVQRSGALVTQCLALNDAVINKGALARMILAVRPPRVEQVSLLQLHRRWLDFPLGGRERPASASRSARTASAILPRARAALSRTSLSGCMSEPMTSGRASRTAGSWTFPTAKRATERL